MDHFGKYKGDDDSRNPLMCYNKIKKVPISQRIPTSTFNNILR